MSASPLSTSLSLSLLSLVLKEQPRHKQVRGMARATGDGGLCTPEGILGRLWPFVGQDRKKLLPHLGTGTQGHWIWASTADLGGRGSNPQKAPTISAHCDSLPLCSSSSNGALPLP
jgi:hypothetical protein